MAKIIGNVAYAHRDYLDTLPPWALDIIDDFSEHIGLFQFPDTVWNVIKVHKRGTISFLLYPDFETVSHPKLAISYLVSLDKSGEEVLLDTKRLDFGERKSPPILHRKELLVDRSHSRYEHWATLTKEEEEAGLLSRRDIGSHMAWESLLKEKGYKILFDNLVEDDYDEDDSS